MPAKKKRTIKESGQPRKCLACGAKGKVGEKFDRSGYVLTCKKCGSTKVRQA